MWDLTIHPLGPLVSFLAHCSVSSSDTNCNSPRPPLADIALFRLLSELPLKVFKMCLLGRGFYTLIKNDLFSSLTDVESHNPLLEVTDLHNGMILSTLSISSHGFALGFPKGFIPIEIVFLTYKPRMELTNVGLTPNNSQHPPL